MSQKPSIAVLAGGFSGEFEVSVKSAKTIVENLDSDLFDVNLIHIREKSWICKGPKGDEEVNLDSFSIERDGKSLKFDYAYIIVHGTPGEDGKLQGYLDMMNVPYNTGSVLCMALTFSKSRTQRLMLQEGVRVARHIIFRKGEAPDHKEILDEIGLPCFVKPSESGSSIGVSMVKAESELKTAIDLAFGIHDEVIVEEMLEGKELACGVFDKGNEVIALPVTEIKSTREFFDYEAKYEDETTQEITPAEIDADSYAACQELSKNIYALTDCRGIARADFFLCSQGLYFVEINTVPGMSKESLVPKQLRAAEIDLKELLSDSINRAIS